MCKCVVSVCILSRKYEASLKSIVAITTILITGRTCMHEYIEKRGERVKVQRKGV